MILKSVEGARKVRREEVRDIVQCNSVLLNQPVEQRWRRRRRDANRLRYRLLLQTARISRDRYYQLAKLTATIPVELINWSVSLSSLQLHFNVSACCWTTETRVKSDGTISVLAPNTLREWRIFDSQLNYWLACSWAANLYQIAALVWLNNTWANHVKTIKLTRKWTDALLMLCAPIKTAGHTWIGSSSDVSVDSTNFSCTQVCCFYCSNFGLIVSNL